MKLDILVVDIAVVLAVILPYIMFIVAGKKADREFRNIFFEEAKKRGMVLEKIDKWNMNMIGFDRSLMKLLLVQRRREAVVVKELSLRKIKQSHVVQETRRMRLKNIPEDVLLRVDLEFDLWNGEQEILNLFDHNETYSQDYEMKNACNLNTFINKCLTFRPVISSAA